MSFEALIQADGYWIVFLGTFLEGETALILAGIAAHSGYLTLPGVIASGFAGSLLCDQAFFFLGRRHGDAILARRPAWRAAAIRVDSLVERYDAILVLGFRFLYGLRTVTPFAIGMSAAISTRRFVTLNTIGTSIWAIVFGSAGYAMGNAVEAILGTARRYEITLFVLVAAVGVVFWVVRFIRVRRSRSRATNERLET